MTGDSSSIFTGIFYDHYSAPAGFCFDALCRDTPFIDNVNSPDYNVILKVPTSMDVMALRLNFAIMIWR